MFLLDHSKGGTCVRICVHSVVQIATSINAHKCITFRYCVLSVLCSPGTHDPRFGQSSPTPLPPMSQPMILPLGQEHMKCEWLLAPCEPPNLTVPGAGHNAIQSNRYLCGGGRDFAVDFPPEKWYGQGRDGEPRKIRLTCAIN